MDALGPRLHVERVWTVNRALARVFWRPCPLLVGARSRWARNTSRVAAAQEIACAARRSAYLLRTRTEHSRGVTSHTRPSSRSARPARRDTHARLESLLKAR
eukprot:614449-Prymnesium_polylepis.1